MTRFVVTRPRMLAAAILAGLFSSASATMAAERFPDFMDDRPEWRLNEPEMLGNTTDFHTVPGETAKPMTWDPAHPYVGNGDTLNRQPTPRITDTTNPILQPWAKKHIDITNKDVLETGKFPFNAGARCWLGGVPGILLYPAEPVFYLQTPKKAYILYQRNHNYRSIFLNAVHSKSPNYSWYGESVGHYENGDTLVIDTVGLDDKGPIDNYRTPHTRQLHVVERHRLANSRKQVDVDVFVEDPGAFTMPWKSWKIYRRNPPNAERGLMESVCAENNADYFDENLVPMPMAIRLDF